MSARKREKIAADRERLEQEYQAAFAAMKATPEYRAYETAHNRLVDHRVLYGTGDLTREPVGIFNQGEG
jgi:hypothetical protein